MSEDPRFWLRESARTTSWIVVVLFAFGFSAADRMPACAATIDVTVGEAAQGDAAGVAKAIQKVIDKSSPGDTIHFPAGVYNVANAVVFKSGRDYAGAGAILRRVGSAGFTACTENDRGKDMTITGLTFDAGGFAFTGSGKVKASGVRISNCSFTNISCKTYPYDVAIYIPIGATRCEFAENHFRNIQGDMGLATWNLDDTRITDNDFDSVNECMHLNGTTANCSVLRNRGVRVHRMGIEIQGSGNINLAVEDNHFANWDSPYHDSFGLSIVPSSGPNISVRYNTVLARPPMPGKWTERFGFGIELGGDVLCRDNLSEGYWWLGIVIGGKNTTVTQNLLRGPNGGEYVTPTKISLEPGSDKATETISNNRQIVTNAYIENPTGLTARRSGTRIDLSWQSRSSNQTGFKIERRKPGGDYAAIATVTGTTTSFRDASAAHDEEYVYRIQAFNAAKDITYSPSLFVARGATVPRAGK